MTASHAGFIFLQCPHQGARNLIKTVLPSVMSSQLRGVGERVTSYIRTRGDAGAALVGSELDGRGRTEQRERDEQFHCPARARSSVRGRHTRESEQIGRTAQMARRLTPTEWTPCFFTVFSASGCWGTVPRARHLWGYRRYLRYLRYGTYGTYGTCGKQVRTLSRYSRYN